MGLTDQALVTFCPWASCGLGREEDGPQRKTSGSPEGRGIDAGLKKMSALGTQKAVLFGSVARAVTMCAGMDTGKTDGGQSVENLACLAHCLGRRLGC